MASKAPLVAELRGAVLRCVRDQNGNHVVQKAVEVFVPSGPVEFMVQDIAGDAVGLAQHNYGCRVVQVRVCSCMSVFNRV